MPTLTPEAEAEVQAWLKRTRKKGPFLLYSTSEIRYRTIGGGGAERSGWERVVIWKEKGKTKAGVLRDGMLARHGIETLASVRDEDTDDVWRSRQGAITPSLLAVMRLMANDQPTGLAEFDPSRLVDLAP